MRATKLQNTDVALQVLLLVDHQLEPSSANRFNGVTGHIKACGIDLTRFLTSSFQEGMNGARQVAMISHHELNFRIGGNYDRKGGYTSSRFFVGGIIDFVIDHFQASFFESIEYTLGPQTAT